jgi:hypothetical protein
MKISSSNQINFANAFADLYLDKENGEFALDLRRQEITLYLSYSQYQALVVLLQQSFEEEQLAHYLHWHQDPMQANDTDLFEVCGPDHIVCLTCTPNCERVKVTFDLGVAIDLAFADFVGLADLVKEAQADLEWRRELLRWNISEAGPDLAAGGQD